MLREIIIIEKTSSGSVPQCGLRILVIAIFLCCIASGCEEKQSEDQQNILVHANNVTITPDEFIKRFELTPRPRQFASSDEVKGAALLSLVAEKLLAHEGYKRGFDSEPLIQRLLREIEREAVVEEVYRQEVRHQVEVSEAEMREAYEASKHVMRVQYFAVHDSLDAQQIEVMLKGGREFSQVAQLFVPDLIDEDGKLPTGTMEWGKSDERLEHAALALRPGEVSGPIPIGNQTFFLYMEDHLIDRFQSEDDYQQQRPRLKKVIINRKESRAFARYLNHLMADSRVRADPGVYNWMVNELGSLLNIEELRSESTILREEIEWSQVSSDLEDQVNTTLITFKNGKLTVGEFLERLWFGSYPLNTKSKSDFRAGIYQTIKRMIEDEFMAREGFKQGFDQRPSVRQEVRIWKESLVAARMRKALVDTIMITRDQMQTHFDANREKFAQPEMVKVQEILVNDEALAQRLLQQIRDGADMGELARRHNKRKQGRENGGILEFSGRRAHGKLGEVAFDAPVGELIGPQEVGPHAFSVLRVLERKQRKEPPFKEVREAVKADLLKTRSQTAINSLVASRIKSPLQFDRQALDTLQVSSINLLTLKLGFPGRLAAPMIHYMEILDEELILAKND